LIGAISAALGNIFRLSSQLQQSEEKTLFAHFDVLECIRLRDPAGARAAMLGLIAVAATDLAPLLERPVNLIGATALRSQ
jgi:DNA-binding FadR family transcriptional regulator